MSALANSLKVSSPNITQVVRELSARGLVARGPDPNDRRATLVSLTEQGRAAVEEMRAIACAATEKLVSRLGEEQARTLIALLGEVEAFLLEEAPQDAPPCRPGVCDKEYHRT